LWKKIIAKGTASRPQVSFLPLVEDKGTTRPIPQPSLKKTLPLIEKKVAAEAAEAEKAAKAAAAPTTTEPSTVAV
jgi:hypothetical protein